MASDNIIGIVVGKKGWEWTLLSRDKNHWSVSAHEKITDSAEKSENQQKNIPVQLKKTIGRVASYVSLACPSDKLLLRIIEIPKVSDDELEGVVRLQADKFSPFPSDIMVVAFELLEEKVDKARVLVASAKEETINEFASAIRESGINPDRIDAEILAKWHLLKIKNKLASSGRQFVFISSDDNIEIIAHENGIPFLFRYIDTAGYQKGSEEINNYIVDELQRMFLAVEIENGSMDNVSILIYSGDNETYLADLIRGNFPYDLGVGDISDLDDVSYGVALRSAYLEKHSVNLIPRAWLALSDARIFRKRIITASAVILGIWLLIIIVVFGGIAVDKWRLAFLNDTMKNLAQPAREVREIRRKVGTMRRYLNNNFSALEYLREICEIQPQGVELSQFIYRKGESLRISGSAQNVEQVYNFKRKMDGGTLLKENSLNGPSLDARKGNYLFEVDIRLPAEEQQ